MVGVFVITPWQLSRFLSNYKGFQCDSYFMYGQIFKLFMCDRFCIFEKKKLCITPLSDLYQKLDCKCHVLASFQI